MNAKKSSKSIGDKLFNLVTVAGFVVGIGIVLKDQVLMIDEKIPTKPTVIYNECNGVLEPNGCLTKVAGTIINESGEEEFIYERKGVSDYNDEILQHWIFDEVFSYKREIDKTNYIVHIGNMTVNYRNNMSYRCVHIIYEKQRRRSNYKPELVELRYVDSFVLESVEQIEDNGETKFILRGEEINEKQNYNWDFPREDIDRIDIELTMKFDSVDFYSVEKSQEIQRNVIYKEGILSNGDTFTLGRLINYSDQDSYPYAIFNDGQNERIYKYDGIWSQVFTDAALNEDGNLELYVSFLSPGLGAVKILNYDTLVEEITYDFQTYLDKFENNFEHIVSSNN